MYIIVKPTEVKTSLEEHRKITYKMRYNHKITEEDTLVSWCLLMSSVISD